jgi:hypothetical protein
MATEGWARITAIVEPEASGPVLISSSAPIDTPANFAVAIDALFEAQVQKN